MNLENFKKYLQVNSLKVLPGKLGFKHQSYLHNCVRQESTIHGIRYFVDGESWAHRVVWMVVMLCSCLYLGHLVRAATVFWDEDPATSTIQRVSLAELQFPAVTVCPDYATPAHAVRTVLNMWVTRHSRHVSDVWQ